MSVWLSATVFCFNPILIYIFILQIAESLKPPKLDAVNVISTYITMLIFVFIIFGLNYLFFKLLGKNLNFNNYFKMPKDIVGFFPYIFGFIAYLVFCIDTFYSPTSALYLMARMLTVFGYFFGLYSFLILYLNWFYKN